MININTARIVWRKSSASEDEECVEVAVAPGAVLLRDSKNAAGSTLAVPNPAWTRLLTCVRHDEFDRVVR